MQRLIIAALIILSCAACSHTPFKKVSYVLVEAVQPTQVRQQFSRALPGEFQLVNTIVFQYNRHIFSAIGYIDVNTHQKTFTVVGLNPLGVKLFEILGNDDGEECTFALPEFTRHNNFAPTVADDIRKIYFDRIPAPEAEVYKGKYKIIFTQSTAHGTMEYVFAGEDNVLIEKRYYQGKRRIWTVFYYEYLCENERLYPAGILLKHNRYGYQLVVRLKEIKT